MDRGAWWATVHGVGRAAHNLATKPLTALGYWPFYCSLNENYNYTEKHKVIIYKNIVYHKYISSNYCTSTMPELILQQTFTLPRFKKHRTKKKKKWMWLEPISTMYLSRREQKQYWRLENANALRGQLMNKNVSKELESSLKIVNCIFMIKKHL